MREEGESRRLVRDVQAYLDSTVNSRLPRSAARYDYLLQRRDQTNDRIRTGLIVLNSASLLGVLTALGTDVIAEERFAIGISDLVFSACCFILGAIFAASAVMVESWRLPEEAAEQFDRLSRDEALRAALDNHLTEANLDSCRDRMQDVHQLPPADFQYSPSAMWLANMAGGSWLAGLVLPLWKIASLIVWYG